MSVFEENKEDILALALSSTDAANESLSSSSGLLDFLNIDPVVNDNVTPMAVTTVANPAVTNPVQQLPPVPQDDDLMDILGLSDDKLDTISNNELDSLLEEASKIEVPKEVEMAFNSPSVADSNKQFKLPQPQEAKLPQTSSPLLPTSSNLMLKPLPNATKPFTTQPVASKSVIPNNAALVVTANSVASNNTSNIIPNKPVTNTVASKISVTEAFKVLGTTAKPLVSLKGQGLINLLNSSIVNTTVLNTSSVATSPSVNLSSSLNLPLLSLASTSKLPSTPTTTATDRR